VGAGVMGAGIAQVCALAGDTVICYDVSAEALAAGPQHVVAGRFGLRGAVERGKITQADADAAQRRLTFTANLDDVADVDLVIEAVPERLDLKIKLFRELDSLVKDETVLASNTSGLPITALAAATDRPDRVIGWHWASPAPVMRLAEIVVTPQTSPQTIDVVCDAARRCGKNPIVVQDNPMHWGFVANRVYFAMVREAQRVVEEGIASRDDVDQLMMDCFRWPSGPFGMVRGAGSGWSNGSEPAEGRGSR
jgi:3-hydroxyacyl-CoA dehydrogenase